ncbi:hypothetical protein K1719_000832 [Acacia pycnantha]|nr:hypothetical protein K1719_000832 [Acacia pycnantha]
MSFPPNRRHSFLSVSTLLYGYASHLLTSTVTELVDYRHHFSQLRQQDESFSRIKFQNLTELVKHGLQKTKGS